MALTREQAWELLNEYNKGEFHLKHGQIVGDVMRWYANELGYGDEADFWETVGLLHDLDFEMYPDEHCIKSQEIMREKGLDERLIRATASHGYGLHFDGLPEPQHEMEKVLFAADELTGLIGAAALTFLVWYRRVAPRNLERALLTCCDVLSVACPCALGRGVRGTVAGAAVVCGSRTWLHELGIDTAALAALPDLHAQAKTELCVTRCGPTRRPPPSSACARRGKRSAWSATASTTRRRSPWRTARSPWAAGRTSPSSRRASCCRPAIWKSCRSCLTFPARPSAPSART